MILFSLFTTTVLILLLAIIISTTTAQTPSVRSGSSFWTPFSSGFNEDNTAQNQQPPSQEDRTCPASTVVENPSRRSPWDPLTREEVLFVSELLVDRLGLNLSSFGFDADRVRTVDAEDPDKSQTLAYLDNDDGSAPFPDRYARAVVSFGSLGPRYVRIYRVGPLPDDLGDDSSVTIESLTEDALPIQTVGLSRSSYSAISRAIQSFYNHRSVQTFLGQAFVSTNTIQWYTHEAGVMRNRTEAVHISWFRSSATVDNILSYPLPLACVVDITSSNNDQWTTTLHSILYRDQFFSTQDEFLAALDAGNVEIVPTNPFTTNPPWQTLNDRSSLSTYNNRRPPTNFDAAARNVEPAARYLIEVEGGGGRRIHWLGWSFHLTNRPTTSMALHDISFQDTRIAYEISVQELLAVYSGNVPHMANKYLFDSFFRFGERNRNLVEGVDCPLGATIFGNTCVFEHAKDLPIWRKDGGRRWYAGAQGTELIVQSMFEVGNYDYIAQVKFRLDGQMDVGFGATGQMFMSYYDPTEEPFGTRVQEEALANLHSHYGAFKVDMDILGHDTNCVERQAVVYKDRQEIVGAHTQSNGLDVPRRSMAIERTLVENEDDGRVVVNNAIPTNWKIVNCDQTNQWGYRRGYEIVHPNTPLPIYMDSFPGFTSFHTIFAQRKETESYLTSSIDMMARGEPLLEIEGGISNGENLVNEDIVAWVSLGFYHVPRAEDNPVTDTITSHFTIRPFNYFDENPSLDLGQTVRYRNGRITDTLSQGDCTIEV